MAIAFGNAAQVLACQNVRDKAIAVEDDFQFAAESNSCVPRTVAEMQADVDALIVALAAAGAGVTGSATSALVANGATVTVKNSAGTNIPGTNTAEVAGSALSDVKLAATNAVVTNGTKVNAVSVTGTGNFATFTVANGVITAITLSAS